MWYKDNYRRIFMDMHLNDTNEEYLSKLDIDNFISLLKEANTSCVVVKAKSHVGLHFWKSKYGKMHKTLEKRDLDYVDLMIKKCRENNIKVMVYFSQIFDNYAYEKHKSWRLRYAYGLTSRGLFLKKFFRYGLVCPNNKNYRKYCKEILTELVEKYDFDGIFLDMPFWPNTCYCRQCRWRFFKETKRIIPRIPKLNKKLWSKFVHIRQDWIDEFIEHNTKVVKDLNERISMEHNMAAIGLSWFHGNTEKNFEHSDYAGGDYYGGYLEQTFMCKYYNNMTKNKPFCYITSRCDNTLYFHTVSRTEQDLLIHAMNSLVHNGAFSICDAMNPDGTIVENMYKGPIKEVFNKMEKEEKHVGGEILSDVAIYYNTNCKTNKNFIQSPFSIAQIFKENNIAFDVIGTKNISSLKAQVLCMNGIQELTDEEVDLLENYLEKGGNLFVSATLGENKKFEKLLGIYSKRTSDYNYSYLSPTENYLDYFKTFDHKNSYPIEASAMEAEFEGEFEVLATLSYPYTKPRSTDFAAIHSNPPGIHTNIPGVVRKKVGKGQVIWCASTLELTKAANCKKAVAALVLSLTKTREFFSNAPEFMEVLKWRKDGDIYFSLINQQSTTPVYPIHDVYIELNEKNIDAQVVSNTKKELVIKNKGGRTRIIIPETEVYHIIKITNKEEIK